MVVTGGTSPQTPARSTLWDGQTSSSDRGSDSTYSKATFGRPPKRFVRMSLLTGGIQISRCSLSARAGRASQRDRRGDTSMRLRAVCSERDAPERPAGEPGGCRSRAVRRTPRAPRRSGRVSGERASSPRCCSWVGTEPRSPVRGTTDSTTLTSGDDAWGHPPGLFLIEPHRGVHRASRPTDSRGLLQAHRSE